MITAFKHSVMLLTSFFVMICLNFENRSITKSDIQIEQYKLVWSDEFNTTGKPDTNNWNFEKCFVRNKELQWYKPDNAFCKDGKLIIQAKHGIKNNSNFISGSNDWKMNCEHAEYTSSSLLTRVYQKWFLFNYRIVKEVEL